MIVWRWGPGSQGWGSNGGTSSPGGLAARVATWIVVDISACDSVPEVADEDDLTVPQFYLARSPESRGRAGPARPFPDHPWIAPVRPRAMSKSLTAGMSMAARAKA